MRRLIIENVRCFRGRHEAPLAPLTILVGENSSGKSTFLALTRLAWDLASGRLPLDFNEEPFLLGAYEQIATAFPGARRERAREFRLGALMASPEEWTVLGIFEDHDGQPGLKEWSFERAQERIRFAYGAERRWRIETPSGAEELPLGSIHTEGKPLAPFVLSEVVPRFSSLRPYAFAPIRTRPQRTYDPVKNVAEPEGSHIPMILANIRSRDTTGWAKLRKALESFGRQSGLFDTVTVRKLGRSDSDPFQIQVRLGGLAVNFADVGYGVSQVLPIVVDCLRGDEGGTYLLQQPEVHLHPKAQAELGSFLGVLAKEQGKRFLIETHSDYLVDRIRMDVRDKKHLKPEDVSILYFERKAGEVQIHPLALDEHGNFQDVPPSYRSFFLDEERRFLEG